MAHWVLGITYGEQKRYAEAFDALQNAMKISGNRPFVAADFGRTLAEAGKKKEAREILKTLNEAAQENYISPVNQAKIYFGLGEFDKVFEYLEKGFEERAVRLPWLLIDPQFDKIRNDERFTTLSDKIKDLSRQGTG